MAVRLRRGGVGGLKPATSFVFDDAIREVVFLTKQLKMTTPNPSLIDLICFPKSLNAISVNHLYLNDNYMELNMAEWSKNMFFWIRGLGSIFGKQ